MRIISKESDYYDIGLQYGIDPHIVWNRTEREVNVCEPSKEEPAEYQALRDFRDCFVTEYGKVHIPVFDVKELKYPDTYVFAFCGKVYTILALRDASQKTKYFTTKEDTVNHYKGEGYEYNKSMWDSRTLNRIEEWFDRIDAINRDKKDVIEKLHIACNSPIVFISGRKYWEQFIIDVNLKDKGFVQIKDPFTAFNELSQYVCNFLCNREPVMTQISDKDMSVKKGFNDKSFRKSKQ